MRFLGAFLLGSITMLFMFLLFRVNVVGHVDSLRVSSARLQETNATESNISEKLENPEKPRLRIAFTVPILTEFNESLPITYGYIDGTIVLGEMIDEAMKNSSHEIDRIAWILPEIQRPRKMLEKCGWIIDERSLPYKLEELENKEYANKVPIDGAIGLYEMMKAEAWTMIEYDRVVVLEPDMMIFRDISHLFDLNVSLMYTKGTVTNEYVNGAPHIIKPNLKVYKELWDIVLEGDFRQGSGWRGSGWGWVYGGRTIQGLYPYYIYEKMDPYDALQIDRCIYNNQVSGQCVDNQCLNFGCWNTPFQAIYMMHYSLCQKPWRCIYHRHPEHGLCRKFHQMWYNLTYKIEEKLGVEVKERCPQNRNYIWMNIYE